MATYLTELEGNAGGAGGLLHAIKSFLQVPHLLPEESRHKLSFLMEDDDSVPADSPAGSSDTSHRPGLSLGGRLCYGAGYTYLAFLAAGGLWGLSEGLRNPLGQKAMSLRWACVLNGMTARGPLVGNTAAAAAVVYNGLHGVLLKAMPRQREGHATAAPCAAVTGALFNASLGARAAAKGAGILTAVVLGYRLAQEYFYDHH